MKRQRLVGLNNGVVVTQWTPLGFKMRDPDSMDDISKERFEGTVLRAICRSIGKVKKEAQQDGGGAEDVQPLLGKVHKSSEKS